MKHRLDLSSSNLFQVCEENIRKKKQKQEQSDDSRIKEMVKSKSASRNSFKDIKPENSTEVLEKHDEKVRNYKN